MKLTLVLWIASCCAAYAACDINVKSSLLFFSETKFEVFEDYKIKEQDADSNASLNEHIRHIFNEIEGSVTAQLTSVGCDDHLNVNLKVIYLPLWANEIVRAKAKVVIDPMNGNYVTVSEISKESLQIQMVWSPRQLLIDGLNAAKLATDELRKRQNRKSDYEDFVANEKLPFGMFQKEYLSDLDSSVDWAEAQLKINPFGQNKELDLAEELKRYIALQTCCFRHPHIKIEFTAFLESMPDRYSEIYLSVLKEALRLKLKNSQEDIEGLADFESDALNKMLSSTVS